MNCDRDPMSYLKTDQLFADTLVHNEQALNLALDVMGHVSSEPFLQKSMEVAKLN